MKIGTIYVGEIENGTLITELTGKIKETKKKTIYNCDIYNPISKIFTKGKLDFSNNGSLREATEEEKKEYEEAKILYLP